MLSHMEEGSWDAAFHHELRQHTLPTLTGDATAQS